MRNFLRIYLLPITIIPLSIYLFLVPLGILINDLNDPGLLKGQIPHFSYRWHQNLSDNFASWARERVASKKALYMNLRDVSATEWPMFSAVYYLWSTEALQNNWEKEPVSTAVMPKVYAADAIEAAVDLITDENNATWVKKYWGEDYLYADNLFYRMLLIAGLTSYQSLTEDKYFEEMLRNQVDTLSHAINSSPYGLLDDYPGACYPVDVLPAIAVIRRADKVLGTDHSAFVKKAIRGFEGSRIDDNTKLPAYIADSRSGQGIGSARGVGISYMLIWAPELWPVRAEQWYKDFEAGFWKEGSIVSGFRELPVNATNKWFFDVDAGPVLNEYGVAASAFGIAAARVNNRFNHAYSLATEALVASWPLADGTLLIPRLLSNLSDAPYLGEAALLFILTREPLSKETVVENVKPPAFVYIFLSFYAFCGIAIVITAVKHILYFRRKYK
jgi:hypothetical protein